MDKIMCKQVTTYKYNILLCKKLKKKYNEIYYNIKSN